jgi:membrane protease YdiL (CAAX protease family)
MDIGGIGAVMLHFTPLDLFLLFFLVAVIPVQSALTGRTFARTPRGELHIVRRFWFNIARAVLLSLLVLLDWRWAGRSLSALGLDIPLGIRGRIGLVLDAVLICSFAFALLWRKLPQERVESARRKLDETPFMPETRPQFLLYALMALVASPAEELLFRGFLLWAFAVYGGVWVAALLSSLVFGLGHAYQGWLGLLRTAFIGFVFAIGFVLTRSLWWLMMAHIAVNLLGGLFAWRVMRLSATH